MKECVCGCGRKAVARGLSKVCYGRAHRMGLLGGYPLQGAAIGPRGPRVIVPAAPGDTLCACGCGQVANAARGLNLRCYSRIAQQRNSPFRTPPKRTIAEQRRAARHQRNLAIVAALKAGATLKTAGEKYGVSWVRAHHIFTAVCGCSLQEWRKAQRHGS